MDKILEIVFEYGWFLAVLFGLVIILGKFIYSNKDKWFKQESQVEDEEILKRHTFFSNAQYRLAIDIPNLSLIVGKPIREKAFKELLKICFNSFYNGAKELIDNEKLSEWDSEQWVDFMTQSINRMVINTEEKAKLDGIPEIMIRKFLDWHLESIESLQEHILLIGNSKIYENVTKTSTLLLVMNLLLVTVLGDAERVLGDLNGEITGLNYKGMIIE